MGTQHSLPPGKSRAYCGALLGEHWASTSLGSFTVVAHAAAHVAFERELTCAHLMRHRIFQDAEKRERSSGWLIAVACGFYFILGPGRSCQTFEKL